MRVRILRPAAHEISRPSRRPPSRFPLSVARTIEPDGRLGEVGVERERLLGGRGRALETVGRGCRRNGDRVVVAEAERGPGRERSRGRVRPRARASRWPLVRLGVAREGLAAEVEVVGLGVLRARGRVALAAGEPPSSGKSPCRRRLEICSRRPIRSPAAALERVAPEQAVRLRVDDLERDAELVALLLEVAGEDVGDAELAAGGLRDPRRPSRTSASRRTGGSRASGCRRASSTTSSGRARRR